MNTPTTSASGKTDAQRPLPVLGDASPEIALPAPSRAASMSLTTALAARRSERGFAGTPLPLQALSDLLWAANGINRPGGGRTAPSAHDEREVAIYVALPQGAYRFDPVDHLLRLVAVGDVRRVTGYQDFVDHAPLDLVFVHDAQPQSAIEAAQRTPFAFAAAGAIAQNVYLSCAAQGLACALRGSMDRDAIARALGLTHNQHVLLAQTVGFPLVDPVEIGL